MARPEHVSAGPQRPGRFLHRFHEAVHRLALALFRRALPRFVLTGAISPDHARLLRSSRRPVGARHGAVSQHRPCQSGAIRRDLRAGRVAAKRILVGLKSPPLMAMSGLRRIGVALADGIFGGLICSIDSPGDLGGRRGRPFLARFILERFVPGEIRPIGSGPKEVALSIELVALAELLLMQFLGVGSRPGSPLFHLGRQLSLIDRQRTCREGFGSACHPIGEPPRSAHPEQADGGKYGDLLAAEARGRSLHVRTRFR